jgi:hypothetical protein
MLFLVEMKLADTARPPFFAEIPWGIEFIAGYVIPTLQKLEKMRADGKVLAGGPLGGNVSFTFIIEVANVLELDELMEGLPLWPRMVTVINPLTTWTDRITAISIKLQGFQAAKGPTVTGVPTPK